MSDIHRCIAAGACRAPKDGHPALTIDQYVLCDACRTNYAKCVNNLGRDYTMLSDALGERQSGTGDYVKSTPTPAIPISVAAEAIMADIYEVLERAASMVASQLDIDQPDARRRTAPKARKKIADYKGKTKTLLIDPEYNSPADHAENLLVTPRATQAIAAWARLVEPKIDVLAAAPTEPCLIWAKPARCEEHTDLIDTAAALVDAKIGTAVPPKRCPRHLDNPHPPKCDDCAHRRRVRREWDAELGRTEEVQSLAAAWHKAADCDTCNGWDTNPIRGQARTWAEYSGLDVLQQITNIHHRTRAHLGHTRLRHHYDTACPAIDKHGKYCGATTVGRDDGTDWVNCTTCGVQWTEREYEFLTTLIKEQEIEVLRWLLAEAYWRLDGSVDTVKELEADERFNTSEAVQLILGAIKPHLEGHAPPANRKTAA